MHFLAIEFYPNLRVNDTQFRCGDFIRWNVRRSGTAPLGLATTGTTQEVKNAALNIYGR